MVIVPQLPLYLQDASAIQMACYGAKEKEITQPYQIAQPSEVLPLHLKQSQTR